MLSKHVTKIFKDLEKKNSEDKYNLFKTEGGKLVSELLQSDLKIVCCWLIRNGLHHSGHTRGTGNCRSKRTGNAYHFQFPVITGSNSISRNSGIPVHRNRDPAIPFPGSKRHSGPGKSGYDITGSRLVRNPVRFCDMVAPEHSVRNVFKPAWELFSG